MTRKEERRTTTTSTGQDKGAAKIERTTGSDRREKSKNEPQNETRNLGDTKKTSSTSKSFDQNALPFVVAFKQELHEVSTGGIFKVTSRRTAPPKVGANKINSQFVCKTTKIPSAHP